MRNGSNNLRRVGDFEIDLEKKILWVNNAPADLPVKAVELLCVLVASEGDVVSKDELLDRVWRDSFVEEGVLTQNVYLLRKTFKRYGLNDEMIQTVARRGYRFIGGRFEPNDERQITIEHEVIEQRFISETEFFDNDVVSGNSSKPSIALPVVNRQRRVLYRTMAAGLLAICVVGLYYKYSDSFAARTRSLANHDGDLQYERLTASGRAHSVGLSPDGENAAYVVHTEDNKYSLTLYHLASKSETVIIPPQELHLFNILFSPDGNYIYYGGQQGEKRIGVYRIPIYGGSGQLITTEFNHKFTLSPDGEWLAFYRRVPEEKAHYLEICRAKDGSDVRTVAIRRDKLGFIIWGAAPAWSADGKKFATAVFSRERDGERGRIHLVEIDVASGEQKDIRSPEWYSVNQPYWESDGKGLYAMVRENRGEPVQLWRIDYPSGEGRKITNDTNDYREFRVSTDSSFILAATWSKAENLFLAPVNDPSKVRQLTYDTTGSNGATALAWTTDGKSLLYSKTTNISDGHLWKLDLSSNQVRQLTFDENTFPNYVDVTPDGNSAVFGYNKGESWHVWQVDLNGENLRQLTHGTDEAAPEISPNGKWIYYLADGLRKQPLGGGESIKVMDKRPGTVRVSPTDSDKFVAYFFDANEKEKNPWKFVLFSETDREKFDVIDIAAIIHFEWRDDGSGIYYADNGESFNNIWFASIKDRARQKITEFTDQRIANFSFSPDRQTVAISRGAAIGNIIKLSTK